MREYTGTINIPNTIQSDSRQSLKPEGAFNFSPKDVEAFKRFLCFGAEGNTFYSHRAELELVSCLAMQRLPVETVVKICEDTAGTFLRPGPMLFALAYCINNTNDLKLKARAYAVADKLCGFSTTMYEFANYIKNSGGFGSSKKKFFRRWYEQRNVDQIVYQALKYPSRKVGTKTPWTHRDVLRLAHPKIKDPLMNDVFSWIVGKKEDFNHPMVEAVKMIKSEKLSVHQVIELIDRHNLTREMLPTELLKDVRIKKALIKRMPVLATIRSLNAFDDAIDDECEEIICKRLKSESALRNAKIHPASLLLLMANYKPERPKIRQAIAEAYDILMKNYTPTNKKIKISLDRSGSMTSGSTGLENVSPLMGGFMLAFTLAKMEPNVELFTYTTTEVPLRIRTDLPVDMAYADFSRRTIAEGTDCSLPYKTNKEYDAIIQITDSASWAGTQPYLASRNYRKRVNNFFKDVIIQMCPGTSSIIDPDSECGYEIVGLSSDTPQMLENIIERR